METKYVVEFAKSGRSACKKCKLNIEKDAIRIGVEKDNGEFVATSWYHVGCFKIPKNSSVEEILAVLEGFHDIDADKQLKIHEALTSSAASITGAKRGPSGASKDKSPQKTSSPVDSQDEVYNLYNKMHIDALKDHLRWNNQVLKGTKPELVEKCVDGHKNGALPACVDCGGKLTPNFALGQVACGGRFNEERGIFVKCYFKAKLADISDRTPWRTSAPTAEERLAEVAKKSGISDSLGEGLDDLFEGIDVQSGDGRRLAVAMLLEKSKEAGIQLPENESDAKVKIGGIMMSDPTATPGEMLQAIALELGMASAKKARVAHSAMGTVCPENEPIVQALTKIAQNYTEQSNHQAANVYRKAIAAIRSLDYVITDGKALTRAKTKVPGVGAKIAELVDKFLTTGSI